MYEGAVRQAKRTLRWFLARGACFGVLAVIHAGTPAIASHRAHVADRGTSESACPDFGTNLVRNGSFEEPALQGVHFRIVAAGRRIGHWSVSRDAVDHIAPRFWEAAHGEQSLDLNECGPGSVSQRVPTAPGDSYRLCFAMAGNPDGPPAQKRVEVIWEGNVVETVEFDGENATRQRMGWTYHRFVVRATGHDAVLSFRSVTPGCYGPVVDHVTLHRLPDPVARGRRVIPTVRATEDITRL
jgi:choice-of-anchor C domain-containing protein